MSAADSQTRGGPQADRQEENTKQRTPAERAKRRRAWRNVFITGLVIGGGYWGYQKWDNAQEADKISKQEDRILRQVRVALGEANLSPFYSVVNSTPAGDNVQDALGAQFQIKFDTDAIRKLGDDKYMDFSNIKGIGADGTLTVHANVIASGQVAYASDLKKADEFANNIKQGAQELVNLVGTEAMSKRMAGVATDVNGMKMQSSTKPKSAFNQSGGTRVVRREPGQ